MYMHAKKWSKRMAQLPKSKIHSAARSKSTDAFEDGDELQGRIHRGAPEHVDPSRYGLHASPQTVPPWATTCSTWPVRAFTTRSLSS